MSVDPISSFLNPEPTEPPPREPRQALWLLHLYLRPRLFFSYFPDMVTPFSTAYTALILGITEVSGRISEEFLKLEFGSDATLPDAVMESWTVYWCVCLAFGVIAACAYYIVGGWWYRVRLNWSGATEPDHRLARQVYVYAYLILALPMLVLTLVDSFEYARPIDAERGEQGWWIVSLVCPFWSVYAGYRGVRTLFPVVKWKARIWFLIFPALFYAMLVVGAAIAWLLASLGVVPMPPDLEWPCTLERPGFSLQYPGNWWVDQEVEDYDPDMRFSITPVQDARIAFALFDEPIDAAEYTASCVNAYQEEFVGDETKPFAAWGPYHGVGAEYIGTTEGSRYRVRVFSTSTAARGLTVMEYSETDVASVIEPGFVLIRKSFRFRD